MGHSVFQMGLQVSKGISVFVWVRISSSFSCSLFFFLQYICVYLWKCFFTSGPAEAPTCPWSWTWWKMLSSVTHIAVPPVSPLFLGVSSDCTLGTVFCPFCVDCRIKAILVMWQLCEGLAEERATSLQFHLHAGMKIITNDVKPARKYIAVKLVMLFR